MVVDGAPEVVVVAEVVALVPAVVDAALTNRKGGTAVSELERVGAAPAVVVAEDAVAAVDGADGSGSAPMPVKEVERDAGAAGATSGGGGVHNACRSSLELLTCAKPRLDAALVVRYASSSGESASIENSYDLVPLRAMSGPEPEPEAAPSVAAPLPFSTSCKCCV